MFSFSIKEVRFQLLSGLQLCAQTTPGPCDLPSFIILQQGVQRSLFLSVVIYSRVSFLNLCLIVARQATVPSNTLQFSIRLDAADAI